MSCPFFIFFILFFVEGRLFMIHKYKLAGYNIVLDVNSGGVHVVDDLTYDILDNIEPPFSEKCPENVISKLSRFYKREDIETCFDEVVEAYHENILFSEDRLEQFSDNDTDVPLKTICLNVSHDCNLRCDYCFASTGNFGGGRKLMSAETGKKAIDFLIENSGDRKDLEIDFFGGEPLVNFDVVKQITEYGRSREAGTGKTFQFTMTTNGVLLDDEKIDFINSEMSNVVLSVDGRREVNDRVRKKTDGTGTYDEIMPKFKKLVNARENRDYYIRGTFTKYNPDFSEDVMSLFDEGFSKISVEPVIADPSEPYALTEINLPKIFKEYEKIAVKILENEKQGKHLDFFHFMIDINMESCVHKRLKGCGCGNEYIAVTPDGDIFPCHRFVNEKDFKMGNISDGTFDREIKKKFAEAHVYKKPECKKCWAKFYCSGGCNANNYMYNGDIYAAHKFSCQLQKKRLECAIMLKAADFL